MGILLFLLFCALVFAGILYVVAGLLGAVGTKKSAVGASASDRLRAVAATKNLDAWQPDSLGLVGLNTVVDSKKGLFSNATSGSVQSVYQENLAAWAAEKGQRETVLLVKTTENELFYRIFRGSGQADIWLDGQPLGSLVGDVLLSADKRAAQPIARIERSGGDEIGSPIIVLERKTAAFAWHERGKKMYPRALDLFGEPSLEEQKILLALTFLEVIRPKI